MLVSVKISLEFFTFLYMYTPNHEWLAATDLSGHIQVLRVSVLRHHVTKAPFHLQIEIKQYNTFDILILA